MFSRGSINSKLLTVLLVLAIIAVSFVAYLNAPDRASAAISLTNKENNVSTSFPTTTTGSLTWTAGARGIASVVLACPGGGGALTDYMNVTGGNVTWTEIGFVSYNRRAVYVFLTDGTPTDGTLSITYDDGVQVDCSGAGTPLEIQYSIDQITGFDTSNPDDPPNTNSASSGTSLNIGDVGTIDAGDLVYAAFGMENASDGLVPATGSTAHVTREGGGNVRSLLVSYSTTDDTPGATWNSSGSSAGVAFIINVGEEAPVDSSNANVNIRGGGTPASSNPFVNIRGGGGTNTVAFDATASGGSGGSATSVSYNHTVGSGSKRAIAVGCSWTATTPTDIVVTVGGEVANLVSGTKSSGETYMTAIYALANPLSGSQTINVTWTNAVYAYCGSVSVTGADQTTPMNNGTFSHAGTGPTASVSITSNSGDLTMDVLATESGATPTSPTQTSRWANHQSFQVGSGGSTGPGTAGPITHQWSTGSGWLISGANFKAAVNGNVKFR